MATNLDTVENAVQSLDGVTCSMATFIHEIDGKISNLCVSGGEGKFFVTATMGVSDAFFTLLGQKESSNQDNNEDEIALIIGGQEVIKPSTELVGIETALIAAKHWAAHREMLQSLHWRHDQ